MSRKKKSGLQIRLWKASTPTQQLNKLTKKDRPDQNRGLLNLKDDFDLEDAIREKVSMIKRLNQFRRNGNSCKGLSFQYSDCNDF